MNADALAALHAAAETVDRPWSARDFDDILGRPGALLIADGDTFALGRVTLDEAELLMIAAHPDVRRRGRATAALRAFHAAARARGAVRAILEVAEDNGPARALYVAHGYVADGCRPGYYRRRDRPPVAAIVMARPLS